MQPSQRIRRGIAAAFVVAALPALSGCAAGFNSPVAEDYNPAVGVNVREGSVYAMNMLVVMPESGQGTLVGSLLNRTPRAEGLVDASVQAEPSQTNEPAESGVSSSMLRSNVTLPSNQLVELSSTPTVSVEGDLKPGRFVNLTLQFQRSKPMQIRIPVVAHTGTYADVTLPQAAPSQSATEPSAPSESATEPSAPASGKGGQGGQGSRSGQGGQGG